MKKCSKCGVEKDESEFSKSSQTKSGLKCYCKACISEDYYKNREHYKEKNRERYLSNLEDRKAKAKAYRENNREKVFKVQQRYRENNKDKLAQAKKEYATKNADKIRAKVKERYKEKREEILSYAARYRQYNKEKIRETNRRYIKENKEKVSAATRKYQKSNRENIIKRHKAYYKANKELAKENARRRANSLCDSRYFKKHLVIDDGPEFKGGFLLVKCKFCGKKFIPTYQQVANRLCSIRGTVDGGNYFYCSDQCKQTCVLFNFSPAKQVDPRSKLYVDKPEVKEVRQCQATQKRHLLEVQLLTDSSNFCEMCGNQTSELDLHHTLPVSKNGTKAINPAGHMLLCPACHLKAHRRCL